MSLNKLDLVTLTVFRHLEEADLSALEWDGEYKHFRRVYANAFLRMQKGLASHWVVELPGKGIIGQVFIQLVCDRPELADGESRAYFYSFRVRPQFRNAGLGSRLLDIIEDEIRSISYRYMTCNVAKDNLAAQRLYLKHDYHIVAHEPGVWSYQDEKGNWCEVEEPAWRMEKHL